jgi:hypothetical protein
MENPSRLPLPPNRLYCRSLKYLEYVKDYDPDVHAIFIKVAIRTNGETKDAKIVNLFSFTFKDIMSD